MNVFNRIVMISAMTSLAIGCGKKDDDSSSTSKTPNVAITGSAVQNGVAMLTYKSNIDGASYECKIDSGVTQATWQSCDASGMQIPVSSGQQMIFSVRAKNGDKLSQVATTVINGTGSGAQGSQLQAVIAEKANPQQALQQDGSVQITFALIDGSQGATFECRVGREGQFASCSSPLRVEREQSGGIPDVTVRPIVNGQYGVEDTISFASLVGGNGQALQMVGSIPLLIGNNYNFVVPEGMHVTEYATTKTLNRGLMSYRIMPESDPLYVGNTRCDQSFDRIIPAMSPSGQPMQYCHSTPPSDEMFKFMTDHRWANNHLSVATDIDRVAADRNNYEMMMMNVFDSDPEFVRSKTRFWDLCHNAVGGRIDVVRHVTLMRNFWGERVRADFWMCTAILSNPVPNGLPEYAYYRVGTFFITDLDLHQQPVVTLPDMNCGTCTYRMPHLLEVVYAARANNSNVTPEFFARTAMQRFEMNLAPAQ